MKCVVHTIKFRKYIYIVIYCLLGDWRYANPGLKKPLFLFLFQKNYSTGSGERKERLAGPLACLHIIMEATNIHGFASLERESDRLSISF